MKCLTLTLMVFALAVSGRAGEQKELLRPVQVEAGGKPIDVQRSGHSAPFVGDFFEDGTVALLVGEFNEGRMRIYRNTGTRAKPKFGEHIWFEAGGKIGTVPAG